MKTFKLLALALMAGAMGFVSCDNDEVGDEGNEEYLFEATCEPYFDEGEPTSETIKAYEETLNNAMTRVGFTKGEAYTLSITGKDSAAVSKVLLEKMKQVESRVAESPYGVKAMVTVSRMEYLTLNPEDEERPYYTEWYNKLLGTPSNATGDPQAFGTGDDSSGDDYHHYRFVKSLWTKSNRDEAKGDYCCKIGDDLNFRAKKAIFLVAGHSGKKSKTENKFAWESQCEGQYITDVVALYSNWIVEEGVPLYIDGRKYYYEEAVHDLNEGVGGDYIYLYVCRDKYAESDGKYYYLNTGGHNPVWYSISDVGLPVLISDGGYGCRSFAGYSGYSFSKWLHESYTAEGHKFVERALQLYTPEEKVVKNSEGEKESMWVGKLEGAVDLNRHVNCYDIRMILSYATKEGGY